MQAAAMQVPAAPTASNSALLDTSQDVGNIVHMEHINLEVPDLEVARLFYGEGLGLPQDPGSLGGQRGGLNVVWYNLGRQQFHICKGPVAQPLHTGGAIGLVMPNVAEVAHRLEAVSAFLGDISVSHLGTGMLEVRDPYGTTFIIHEKLEGFSAKRGIAYVLLPCHVGTAPAIADFYRKVLRSEVNMTLDRKKTEVVVGPGSKLVFVEQAALGPLSTEAVHSQFSGWHVALYLAQFSPCYGAAEAAGLVCNQHPYRDKCHNFSDALRNHQFRLRDVPLDMKAAREAHGGADKDMAGSNDDYTPAKVPLAFQLQLEVRNMHHPMFMRSLYNRPGSEVDGI